MMKRIVLILFSLIIYSCGKPIYNEVETMNRGKKITGKIVVDSKPTPGVNISIKKTKIKVQTDFDGYYNILVNDNDKLLFDYSGCETQEIEVRGKDSVNVFFKQDENFIKTHTIMVKKSN